MPARSCQHEVDVAELAVEHGWNCTTALESTSNLVYTCEYDAVSRSACELHRRVRPDSERDLDLEGWIEETAAANPSEPVYVVDPELDEISLENLSLPELSIRFIGTELSNLTIRECTFADLSIAGVEIDNIHVSNTDVLGDTTISHVSADKLWLASSVFGGHVTVEEVYCREYSFSVSSFEGGLSQSSIHASKVSILSDVASTLRYTGSAAESFTVKSEVERATLRLTEAGFLDVATETAEKVSVSVDSLTRGADFRNVDASRVTCSIRGDDRPVGVDFRTAHLPSLTIRRQSSDAPAVFDLADAKIGALSVDSDSSIPVFETLRLLRTDLSDCELIDYHEQLDRVGWQFVTTPEEYRDALFRTRCFEVDLFMTEDYLWLLEHFDDLANRVAERSDLSIGEMGRALFSADEIESLRRSESEYPAVLDRFTRQERESLKTIAWYYQGRESPLEDRLEDEELKSAIVAHAQHLASAPPDVRARYLGDELSPKADAARLKTRIETCVTLAMQATDISRTYDIPGHRYHAVRSELAFVLGRLVENRIENARTDPISLPTPEKAVTLLEAERDPHFLTAEESDLIEDVFSQSLLLQVLDRVEAELASRPSIENAFVGERTVDAKLRRSAALCRERIGAPRATELTASPRDVETTYLRAKASADNVGDSLAAARFFEHERRSRRPYYVAQIFGADSHRRQLSGVYSWLSNTLLDWTTGFGERPQRVVGWSLITVLSFSAVYWQFYEMTGATLPAAFRHPLTYLILSMESFITLVHNGSIEITSPALLFITQLEGFIGAFFIGLFVFTLTRSIHR